MSAARGRKWYSAVAPESLRGEKSAGPNGWQASKYSTVALNQILFSISA